MPSKQTYTPAQKKRKAAVRAARNKSGKNTDYQAAVARGDENVGSKSKSAQTHADKAAHEKKTGKKIPKGKDFGHKKSLKDSNGSSTAGGAESKSKNRSKGGKSGNAKGKGKGGSKSSRKGIKNKPR